MKTFSIVVPFYYNELNIPYTVPRLKSLDQKLPKDIKLELVFVDDGSGDKTLDLLLKEQKADKRIKVVKLSKNFGSMSAVQAGLANVTGDCIGIIAADLQDPPELFIDMILEWRNGKKVVLAVRQDREEPFLQKLISNTFYKLMAKFAIPGYPSGGFDFVLIDRQVADSINAIHEKNTNIMSLIFWMGHDRAYIPYTRLKREHGKSKWTFSKKIKFFIDSFIAFSYAPIRFMTFVGLVTAFFSFIFGAVLIYNNLRGIVPVQGWTSILVTISFFSGLILITLGVIGEYLWRILDESRKRPSYVVDEIYTAIKKNNK